MWKICLESTQYISNKFQNLLFLIIVKHTNLYFNVYSIFIFFAFTKSLKINFIYNKST